MIELQRLARKRTLRVAGLMSGTSADGVDVAVVDIVAGRGRDARPAVKVQAFDTFPYSSSLRADIFKLFDPATSRVDHICHMNAVLGEVFADAVRRLCRKKRLPLASIDLIGSHGQTIWHNPVGAAWPGGGPRPGRASRLRSTLQIGEPSVIAERTGITTVADFRPRDIAAGGQGAPLVPYADYVLFGDARVSRALQNIGGIANVTFLPAGGGVGDIAAFDTGPGNMIIDRLAQRLSGGRLGYDIGGALAAAGKVNRRLLGRLMRHPYLRRRPPKTTGREEFGVQFADELLADARRQGVVDADTIATATAFTAASIADACRRFLPALPDEMILCGGGAWNATLVGMLSQALAPAGVRRMDELGVSPDAKEAVSFAILAYETIHGRPSNVPAATGAKTQAVLGKICLSSRQGLIAPE